MREGRSVAGDDTAGAFDNNGNDDSECDTSLTC